MLENSFGLLDQLEYDNDTKIPEHVFFAADSTRMCAFELVLDRLA